MGLRRLVIEFFAKDLTSFLGESLLEIDSMQTLAFLRDTPEEVTLICRIRLKNPSSKPKDALHLSGTQVHVLEQEEKDTYTVLMKNKRNPSSRSTLGLMDAGAYIVVPYEISDGLVKMTFLGTAPQTRKTLQTISKSGVSYKVISLSDARFAHNSPLNRLTNKQRKVLLTAYYQGYYDLPKKISSKDLAGKLNMRSSTFVTHRIKAEKRLLDAILREE